MNINDIPVPMPPLSTISECHEEVGIKNPAHSNGRPDACGRTNHISVRFAALSESWFEIRIKRAVPRPAHTKPAGDPVLFFTGAGHNPG
jgi:hypothetical protein